MRNLEVTKCVVLQPDRLLSEAHSFCLDCDSGALWVATNNDLCCIENNKVSSMAPLCGHLTTEDSVVGMEFVADLESVCLAVSTGDILLYNTSTCELDCVGSVEVGVVCMGWSPEQDVVVLVTKGDKLVLMTRDFDSITEVTLHPDHFGEAKPVTVGWGKKETQFHGSQGKPKAAQLEKKPVAAALEGDDRRTRISWRGDGEYFVCSTINPGTGARQLRVWSRECVLHSTSENVDGLEQPLHWRPNGSLIASTQQKPHRHDVVFFERNGLQHGEFPLIPKTLSSSSSSSSSAGDTAAADSGRCVQVQEMMWSCDSTVLALWIVEKMEEKKQPATNGNLLASDDRNTYVQLWTTGNYHWYLKQELHLPTAMDISSSSTGGCDDGGSVGLVGMLWDPISPLTLHLLTKAGQYMCYNWRWSVAKSLSCSAHNAGCVAVIDGPKLLLTPFRHMIVPPPMAAHTIHLPSAVNLVAFAPPPNCNDFLVVLASGQVGVFSYDITVSKGTGTGDKLEKKDGQGFKEILRPPHLLALTDLSAVISGRSQLHSLRQLLWWKRDHLLAVGREEGGGGVGGDYLMEISVEMDKEKHSLDIKLCHRLPVPGAVLNLSTNPDSLSVALQLTDGSVLKYDSSFDSSLVGTTMAAPSPSQSGDSNQPASLSPWLLCDGREMKFPDTCCEHVAIATFSNGEEYPIGLSESRRSLYIGDKKLVTGCTSFALHNEFLLFTTDTHTCRFVPLDCDPQAVVTLSPDQPHVHDESVRRVERGSKVVTVVPHDTRLVLQMPRGNLETISPRALVLSCVRRHLDRVQFKSAFGLMKKHRINMNLIYDHNPKEFLKHSKEFVGQLDSVADINLFLTELKNEDVTTTMYPSFRRTSDDGRAAAVEEDSDSCSEFSGHSNKVDCVCVSLRRALNDVGANKYLLSIITTYVKMTDPQLETVLEMIKQLKEKPSSSEGDRGGALTAEDALKYTLFLVDVNQLYNVALGMYDFSLVLLVAEKSQKDPKEYLPFLNELRRLPLHYQRYRIDRYLRRFDKALQHISKCGPDKFSECLSLVKEQSLYSTALTIYPNRSSNEYKTIAKSYGEYLVEKGQQREAGIAFCQCDCLAEAMASFEKAGCWRQIFTVATQLNKSEGEKAALARRIANSLKTSRRYSEAARVLIDYAVDVEEAIVALLEGSCWEEALRLSHLHHRTDLLETHLKPSLLEAHQTQVALFDNLQSTYLRHTTRLAVVREIKRQKQNAILEGTYAADEKDADLFSDTSSVTGRSAISSVNSSLLSKASGRSIKNRRKAERKKHSLREGSANEDLALMEALTETVNTVDRLQDEVASLLGMLVQYGFTEEGRNVQRTFECLLSTVKSKMDTIWSPRRAEQPLSDLSIIVGMTTGPGTTVNSIVAALAAAKEQTSSLDAGGVASAQPTIRDTVRWKLDILS